MAKKKSLPTQLKEVLHYHVSKSDISSDAEFKSLIKDLNKLDRKIANVKRQIMQNRKAREQAQKFTQELNAVTQKSVKNPAKTN